MRVLEAISFDKLPTTPQYLDAAYSDTTAELRNRGGAVPGTRLSIYAMRRYQFSTAGFQDYITRTDDGWMRLVTQGNQPNFAVRIQQEYTLLLADYPTDVQASTSRLTLGVRMRYVSNFLNSLYVTTGGIMVSILMSDDSRVDIVTSNEWVKPMTTLKGHYFEVSYERATNVATLWRDGVILKDVGMPDGLTFKGFIFGCQNKTGDRSSSTPGRITSDIRDVYLAEFNTNEPTRRLGPQTIQSAPIVAVNATTWPTTVAGKGLIESLNDSQVAMFVPDANPTMVTVGDQDAVGTITLDTSAVGAGDRVTALVITCDALSTSVGGQLQAELMNGGVSEATNKVTFGSAFNYKSGRAGSNFNRKLFAKTFTTASSGTKAAVGAYALKLKAVVPS